MLGKGGFVGEQVNEGQVEIVVLLPGLVIERSGDVGGVPSSYRSLKS
jgi:hypothetical protein